MLRIIRPPVVLSPKVRRQLNITWTKDSSWVFLDKFSLAASLILLYFSTSPNPVLSLFAFFPLKSTVHLGLTLQKHCLRWGKVCFENHAGYKFRKMPVFLRRWKSIVHSENLSYEEPFLPPLCESPGIWLSSCPNWLNTRRWTRWRPETSPLSSDRTCCGWTTKGTKAQMQIYSVLCVNGFPVKLVI